MSSLECRARPGWPLRDELTVAQVATGPPPDTRLRSSGDPGTNGSGASAVAVALTQPRLPTHLRPLVVAQAARELRLALPPRVGQHAAPLLRLPAEQEGGVGEGGASDRQVCEERAQWAAIKAVECKVGGVGRVQHPSPTPPCLPANGPQARQRGLHGAQVAERAAHERRHRQVAQHQQPIAQPHVAEGCMNRWVGRGGERKMRQRGEQEPWRSYRMHDCRRPSLGASALWNNLLYSHCQPSQAQEIPAAHCPSHSHGPSSAWAFRRSGMS